MSRNKFKPQKFDKKLKIKTKVHQSNYKIEPSKIGYETLHPTFSFANYIKNSKYYTEEHCNNEKDTLYKFMNAMKDISSFTWREIKQNKSQFHAHDIDEKVSEISELSSFDENIPFFQFKLPNHDKGRFIGYFDETGIFNIVLIDRMHQIYKRK